MPCNTYQGENSELHNRYNGRHEELAIMLCKALSLFDELIPHGVESYCDKETIKWFKEHKEWDKKL